MDSRFPDIELEFDWHLTNRCNFDCTYCHPQIKRVLNRQHLDEPHYSLVAKRFNDTGKICGIHMSGGEPFMFPDFLALCRELTKKHYISINTNLSHHALVKSFSEEINPNRVILIAAALHITEREKHESGMDKFIDFFLLLQEKGFPATVYYVLYPPLLQRFVADLLRMEKAGIHSISPKTFKGVYKRKRYPEGYSAKEKELIRQYRRDYTFMENYLEGQMCFRGQLCNAGYSFFKVNVTGRVQRCATVKGNCGNLYTGTFKPMPNPCPCPAKRVLAISQCHRHLVCPRIDATNQTMKRKG